MTHNGPQGHPPGLSAKYCDRGTRRATFNASPSKLENNCNAAVSLSQPFDRTIASKTCRYCSQLVVPSNRGTFVESECHLPRGTPGHHLGNGRCSQQPVLRAETRQVLLHPSNCVNQYIYRRSNIPPSVRTTIPWTDLRKKSEAALLVNPESQGPDGPPLGGEP